VRASAQAFSTEEEACTASAAVPIFFGNLNSTGRPLLGGNRRSRQSRRAVLSPSKALSISLRVIALASPSRSASARTVALLRAPLGLPFGLPLLPRSNGQPRCFAAVFSAWLNALMRTTFPLREYGCVALRLFNGIFAPAQGAKIYSRFSEIAQYCFAAAFFCADSMLPAPGATSRRHHKRVRSLIPGRLEVAPGGRRWNNCVHYSYPYVHRLQ
jgi:hypothetical protein